MLEKKIKNLQIELNKIIQNAEAKVDTIKKKTSRASGGIKRMAKGDLVEEIYSRIIKFCLNEKKSKLKLINKMGNLPKNVKKIPVLKVSKDYANLKNLKFTKKELTTGYEDKFDGFILNNQDIKIVLEYKAYSENTMLKRCLVDASIAQIFDKNIKYCLCLLQSHLYQNERLVGYNAHSLMDFFYQKFKVNVDILILVKEPRVVNEDIIKKKYQIDYKLLENAVNYFLNNLES
tara:strand:- start:472 stop:1170 length:699 start_codon:yes stop_codon:yes gene_type:complete